MDEAVELNNGRSFTHIDGVRFSSYANDVVKDSIEVKLEGEADILHNIVLKQRKAIDRNLIRSLFREGSKMSLKLVSKQEDTSNG